jgi:iron(III) transport system permease protein
MNETNIASNPDAEDRAVGGPRFWLNGSPIVVCLILLLLLLIGPPLVYLVHASLHASRIDGSLGDLTVQFYRGLFANPRFADNFLNTLIYSCGSAALAVVIGTLQAWIVERTNTPLRSYAFLCAILSLSVPQVLYTVAWLLILGKSGPLNDVLRSIFRTDDAVFNVYSMGGMILIEGLTWAPLAFLMLSSILRSVDASLEEAAFMAGANVRQTFWRITLRLAMPAVAALLLLIVIRSFESFEIPALVGLPGRVRVLTTDIYEAVEKVFPPDYGQAAAFSVVLLIIVAIMLSFYSLLSKQRGYQTITGKGFRPRVTDLGRFRFVTSAILILFFVILIILPVSILVLASFQPFYERVGTAAFLHMTLSNYREVLNSGSLRDSIGNTLVLGATTATLVGMTSAVSAWLAVRRYRGAWILDQLATMPLAFPAMVLGLAFMQLYLVLPLPLYGQLAGIVIASLVLYLPYGMRYSYAGVLQISIELEEVAAISGASAVTIFVRIVLPLIAPAVVACWLFVFLITVRAVAMVILLAGPGSQVVAVTLFDLWSNGQTAELAAMGVAWMAFMTCIGLGFFAVARRFGLALT